MKILLFQDYDFYICDVKHNQTLSNTILKLAAPVLIPPNEKLINRCIHEQQSPSVLKVAKIVPPNNRDSKSFENYRPIPLLSPIGKKFQRFLYVLMMEYTGKIRCSKSLSIWFLPQTQICRCGFNRD